MPRNRITGSGAHLTGEWTLAATAPGRATSPADLECCALEWIPCESPMPVAAALRAAGRWDLDHPRDFDADDWWYRCRFTAPDSGQHSRLHFDGLATIADVWLNGVHILRSDSMFVASAIDVSAALRADNDLVLRFSALGPLLAARRPRPKWRTRLVSHQQLRWHRTALLGRLPAWCPPVAPVGPWRPVRLVSGPLHVDQTDVRAQLVGDDGVVQICVAACGTGANPPASGTVAVGERGEWSTPVAFECSPDGRITMRGNVRVPRVERWWPHTHGRQPLYPVTVSVDVDGATIAIDLGRVGFRALEIDRGTDGEGFGLVVNGVDVFGRGVCWTPLDVADLDRDVADYRTALEQLRDAGVNIVRVGGTMVYETDAFYDLCDTLGLLVWQDFMFANMDYPADEAFTRTVALEARQLLHRVQGRPSIAVVCGSSEVEQQCAMLGLPADRWANPLFDELLPGLVDTLAPDVTWLRSTPTGGTLPFHTDRGVSHYYGVGAYLRPFDDARRANVRFASECLAFSNIPDAAMVDSLLSEGAMPGHHPRWKAGVPRDAGAGWDFEDVRDHYVRVLFGVEPSALRARDPERYLAVGRAATGEAMLRTFAEWRRPGSSCRGGLVWCARDLSPGAGWGVIDAAGRPKAAYWYLKRVFAPIALLAIDEGLNGLWLHAMNDTSAPVEADLRIALYRDGRVRGRRPSTAVTIPARGSYSVHADALFEGFVDLTYAYRFGPPEHDVVGATLRDRATGAILATAHCFPAGLPATVDPALGLVARAEPCANGYVMTLHADRFAHAVAVDAEGYIPDDNYLHLEPNESRRIILRAEVADVPLRGSVRALNGPAAVSIAAHAEPLHAR